VCPIDLCGLIISVSTYAVACRDFSPVVSFPAARCIVYFSHEVCIVQVCHGLVKSHKLVP
jgi:hypothetical protein